MYTAHEFYEKLYKPFVYNSITLILFKKAYADYVRTYKP